LHELPNIDDGIGYPQWQLALCLLGCYVMLFLILWKGVASSGKASYFTGKGSITLAF
jgi:solute carrier family 6 amino acid transporter-like protein 5/7/9/14